LIGKERRVRQCLVIKGWSEYVAGWLAVDYSLVQKISMVALGHGCVLQDVLLSCALLHSFSSDTELQQKANFGGI
jgi:hypothetical protein